MNKQTLFFDLDDTLIHCNKYFELIITQFIDQMETWLKPYEITSQHIRNKQQELDIAGVHIHGFNLDHFPQSFVDTYEHYCHLTGMPYRIDEADWLRTLGSSVYDQEFEAYPNMFETLHDLKDQGHTLCLYTGGVAAVQQKKVDKLELARFFENRIYIAQHKTTDAFRQILASGVYDRATSWMIGNSLRTDILPALHNGLHAIYIPAELEWQYNIVDIDVHPPGHLLTLSSLLEVPPTIEQLTAVQMSE